MTGIASQPLGAVILSGVAGVLLAMSSSVMAQESRNPSQITVRTHDIDLSSPAGIERLQQRVNSAIRAACAPAEFGTPTTYGLGYMSQEQSDCLADARSAIEPKVQRLIANGSTRVAAN
jgi:UrcA family protein